MYLTYDGKKHKTFPVWLLANYNQIFAADGKIICTSCDGTGRIYDPDDPPDCYEGNKLRNVIKCSKCNGAKTFELTEDNLKPFHEKFLMAEKNWQKDEERKKFEFISKELIRNKLFSVLSPEEMKRIKII